MVKWTGRDRLRFVLTKLPKEMRAELRTTILDSANDVANTQRALTPVKTGKLRESIVVTPADQNVPRYASLKSKRTVKDPFLAAIISAGNSEVRYAHLVEFGTAPHLNEGRFPGTMNPGSPPQPFFYPGFRAEKKRAKNKINRAARKAIKQGIR